MPTRRFELVDAKSAKFWEISQDGAEYTVSFGKIGTKGQTKTKTLANQDAANAEVAKLIKEKTGKGYVEVSENVISHSGVEDNTPDKNEPPAVKKQKFSDTANKAEEVSSIVPDSVDCRNNSDEGQKVLTKAVALSFLNDLTIDLSSFTKIEVTAAKALSPMGICLSSWVANHV